MLKRDDELRLSDDVQARYALEPESWDWKWQVTEEVQRRVCEEFGFGSNVAEGVDLLRSSKALFPGDDEVKQAAHYLRFNTHEACPISIGTKAPELTVYSLSGEITQFCDITRKGRATVVFAGSHT